MNGDRKVLEVILSLEKKVKKLKAMVQNQDFKIMLILQAIKKSDGQPIEKRVMNDIAQPNIKQAKPIMPGLKPGVVMGPNGLQNKSEDEEFELPEVTGLSNKPVELEESLPEQEKIVGQRRTNRYNNNGI